MSTTRNILSCLALLGFQVFLVAIMPNSLMAQTAKELVEKGIYQEETVGDLDKAIVQYQEALKASQDSITVAAEAQFRLAGCLEKQGKTKQAEAAYQVVIDKFGAASQWVSKAKAQLSEDIKLLPVPWGEGDEIHLSMKMLNGKVIGHQIFKIASVTQENQKYWECQTWQRASVNSQAGYSRVLVDSKTFFPLKSEWDHTAFGSVKADYSKGKVSLLNTAVSEEKRDVILDEDCYDNEQTAQVFRRLPLKVGMRIKSLPLFPTLGGTPIPLGLTVSKLEEIEVPAGKFECFRIDLDIGQSFFISNDKNRYIVRFQAGGISADLVKVQPITDKPSELTLPSFSATLPVGWHSFELGLRKNAREKLHRELITQRIYIDSYLKVRPIKELSGRKTPVSWMKKVIKNVTKSTPGLTLTDSGVESVKINGQDAAVATWTYTKNEKKFKARRWTIWGKDDVFGLQANIPEKDFDTWIPRFEKMANSVQAK